MHFAGYVIHDRNIDLKVFLEPYDNKKVEPYVGQVINEEYYGNHPWFDRAGQRRPVDWTNEVNVREYLNATSPWINWDEEVRETENGHFALLSTLNPLYQYDWYTIGGRWCDWLDDLGFESPTIPFSHFWSTLQIRIEPDRERMSDLYDRFMSQIEANDASVLHLPAGEFNASDIGRELAELIPTDQVEGWWIQSPHWFYWVSDIAQGTITKDLWVTGQLPYLTTCFVDKEGDWYGSSHSSEIERARTIQHFLEYCSDNEESLSEYDVTLIDFHR